MGTYRLGLLISTAFATSFSFVGVAKAQLADEIIVTATKREKTLQETPLSVSVTSAETMERARIVDISDLQSVVPSLQVTERQSTQNTTFIIRGFGNGANNTGIEPSVGVFIDGVYRSRAVSQITDLPKLQRVEVLNGPQSTLFGKNASSGVISITTSKPSFDTTGYVEAGVGNFNQRLVRGYVSGGISDNVAVSLGGSWNKRDGYFDAFLADRKDTNDRNRWNLRAQALFEPSDNVSLRLIADYSDLDEICCSTTAFVLGSSARAVRALGGVLGDPNNQFNYVSYADNDSNNFVTDKGISAHLDVDLGNVSLTSISSYRKNDAGFDFDGDFTTARIVDLNQVSEIKTITQELRLTSANASSFEWMLGGYFFKENIDQSSGLYIQENFRAYAESLLGPGGSGLLGLVEAANGLKPGTIFKDDQEEIVTVTQRNTAYSLFGTADFHVSDKLTVMAGLNYTKDKKNVTANSINTEIFSTLDFAGAAGFNSLVFAGLAQNFPGLAAAFGLGPLPFTNANVATLTSLPGGAGALAGLKAGVTGAVSGLDLSDPKQNPFLALQKLQFVPQLLPFPNSVEDGRSSDDKITYTLRAAYKINDNVNIYASTASGFKATSWNLSRDSRPTVSDRSAIIAAGLARPNQKYRTRFARPEDVVVYELGLKSQFDNGFVNVAVFNQTVNGFQDNTFLGSGFALVNAGIQRTNGVEIDASYVPVDPLTLTFSVTFLDAKFKEYKNATGPNNTTVDRSGEKVAGVPRFNFSTSATYTHEFYNGMTGYVRGDFQHASNVKLQALLDAKTKVNIFNGSLGVQTNNGLAVQIWARNLFGGEHYLAAFPGPIQSGTTLVYPNQPRTYGISVRKNF
ncbi:MAG: TonB-dependent receptor [Robiginitomaculum sp.]